jgi:VWFA-related protein
VRVPVLAVVLAAVVGGAQRSSITSGDLVELDVVALDKDDRPVLGLQPAEFQVREDGHTVDLKTFIAPSHDPNEDPEPRQLVLLLDDSSIPATGTKVIQAMAKGILSRGTVRDEVTVVRLNNNRDEPYGDVETALSRIDGYTGGVVPYHDRDTADRLLRVIASISRQLEATGRRRKLMVCIGGPPVCNVLEPRRGFLFWDLWVDAIASASRANLAVYAAMPVPFGTSVLMAGGLADVTGGDAFANETKFETFVDRLWAEARDYYLLGYWPSAGGHGLHSIDVKIKRKGVHVRARRARG